ncbi:MAG TPA: MFS transporter [Baekduia sp.]|nr:MFS transporter [Baekduia sp.]
MTATALRAGRAWRNRRRPLALRALVAFSAVAVGAGLGRALVTTYLPVLLERIRDAPGLIGTVMLVNTVAGFFVPLAIGAWSDRLRAHGHTRTLPVVLGGTLLAAGGLVAIALGSASSYLALALAAAVAYLGLNAMTTGHRALIPQTFAEGERAAATAGEEAAMLAGTLVGVVAGGILVEIALWAPFALGAVVLPVLAVPTVRGMRGREQPPERQAEVHAGVRYYARAAARPRARLVLVAQGLWVLGYVGLPPFFVLYAERELGLGAGTAGLVLAAFGLVSGAAMLLAGLARPGAQQRLLLAGAAAMGGGMLLVAGGSSLATVGPGLVPVALGFGVLTTLGFPVYAVSIPAGEEGAYSALYFAVRSVASAIALPVAGWTIALTDSYRTLFVLGGAVTLAALVPLARLGRQGRDGPAAPATPPARRARDARVVVVRAALFAAVTAAVYGVGRLVHGTELLEIDVDVFRAVEGLWSTPQIVDALIVDPHIRNYALLTLLAGAAGHRWGDGRAARTALLVAAAGLVAYAAVRACWALWERPRPEELLGTQPANGHAWSSYPSFPSGHVVVTTAMVVAAVTLVPVLAWPLAPFALLIAVTRVSYGAHFPSDVVAGVLLGWTAAAVVVTPRGASLAPMIVALRTLRGPRATRLGRVVGLVSLAGFALLLATVGVPASPEGGVLEATAERDAQRAALALAAGCVAGTWWRAAFAVPLLLAAGALGVLAATQWTPAFAALAFAAFAAPAVLVLLGAPWAHGRRHVVAIAGLVAAVTLAAGGAAVAMHDAVYGPQHPASSQPAPPTWRVSWVWAGGLAPDGATVTARLTRDARARLVVGRRADLRDGVATPWQEVGDGDDRLAVFRLRGLTPDTDYHYGVEVDGRVDPHRRGRLRTLPTGASSWRFAVGACARVGSNGAVFDAIAAQDPRFYVITGDLFYSNIATNDPGRFQDAYDRTLTQPAQGALYRRVPVAYVWDDHDFGGDGADGTSPSRPAARDAYERTVPHAPLAADGPQDAIHQAFTAGRVRFLLLDTRSQRSPSAQRDDARKTMLGAAQKAWLKRELLAARDRQALTVIVSSVPWIGRATAGADTWAGYATERAELSRFLARNRIDRLLMLAGDAHMVAVDDGSNSDYSGTGRAGFPVLHAGALDRPGSVKGGPYSEGAFPGAGQFATVDVADDGDRLRVRLTGRRYDGRVLVRHSFVADPPGP